MEIRAVIYTRVSTEYQDEGHSIVEQKRRCEMQCELLGHEVVGYFHDTSSGSNFDRRDEYNKMMKEAGGEWDLIIVYKLDRIHRNLRNSLFFLEQLQSLNCDIISVTEQIDTSTPMGKFMFSLIGALAQMEREQTAERVKMGMVGARNKGRWIGQPPYGYTIDTEFTEHGTRKKPGVLVPFEDEIEAVRIILENHNISTPRIQNKLIEGKCKTRSGSLIWNRNTIQKVVDRAPLYLLGATKLPSTPIDEYEIWRTGNQEPLLDWWLYPDIASKYQILNEVDGGWEGCMAFFGKIFDGVSPDEMKLNGKYSLRINEDEGEEE